jgi:hypothetical protein
MLFVILSLLSIAGAYKGVVVSSTTHSTHGGVMGKGFVFNTRDGSTQDASTPVCVNFGQPYAVSILYYYAHQVEGGLKSDNIETHFAVDVNNVVTVTGFSYSTGWTCGPVSGKAKIGGVLNINGTACRDVNHYQNQTITFHSLC